MHSVVHRQLLVNSEQRFVFNMYDVCATHFTDLLIIFTSIRRLLVIGVGYCVLQLSEVNYSMLFLEHFMKRNRNVKAHQVLVMDQLVIKLLSSLVFCRLVYVPLFCRWRSTEKNYTKNNQHLFINKEYIISYKFGLFICHIYTTQYHINIYTTG